MKKIFKSFLLLLPILSSFNLSASPESMQSKLQAYDLAIRTRYQLNQALPSVDAAIIQSKAKVASYQAQVDDGVTTASPMLDLYKKKLSELKKTRADAQGRVDQLNKIIEDLKKDPDVGSQINASEALSQMNSKLQEASSMLPKMP